MKLQDQANYREYRHFERSDWPKGEWLNEPDKVQWIDAATGLDCLIVRNRVGALCGYVGVPTAHPWHGKHYNNEAVEVRVHGGLTFSDRCAPMGPDAYEHMKDRMAPVKDYDEWKTLMESCAICHVPAPGRTDDIWWFGFDCAHSMDLQPLVGFSFSPEAQYRDLAYVAHDVQSLAQQLAAVRA